MLWTRTFLLCFLNFYFVLRGEEEKEELADILAGVRFFSVGECVGKLTLAGIISPSPVFSVLFKMCTAFLLNLFLNRTIISHCV